MIKESKDFDPPHMDGSQAINNHFDNQFYIETTNCDTRKDTPNIHTTMINKSRGKYRQERNYQEEKSETKSEENLLKAKGNIMTRFCRRSIMMEQ